MAYPNTQYVCCICEKTFFSCEKPQKEPVCKSFDCQRLHANKTKAGANNLTQHFTFQSQNLRGKIQQEQAEILRIKAAEQIAKSAMLLREEEENREIYRKTLEKFPELDRIRHPMVALPPYHHRIMGTLSEERKENYLRHIREIIDISVKKIEHENTEPASPTVKTSNEIDGTVSTLNRMICGICEGRCCINGGDKAYLKPQTIERYMREYPELSPEQVFNRYAEKMSEQTHIDSCINHTDKGCILPREMRSDTCNDFYCDAVKKFNRAFSEQETPPEGAVVIRRPLN